MSAPAVVAAVSCRSMGQAPGIMPVTSAASYIGVLRLAAFSWPAPSALHPSLAEILHGWAERVMKVQFYVPVALRGQLPALKELGLWFT